MNMQSIAFAPLLSPALLWAMAALVVLTVAVFAWRGTKGWWLRGLAGLAILAALAGPQILRTTADTLDDIVFVFVDRSSSQTVSDRVAQTDAALEDLQTKLARRGETDVRVVEVSDQDNDGGTALMAAMAQAFKTAPSDQIAGSFVISDGQVHDAPAMPETVAPTHLLLTGQNTDWDRRLVVVNAPTYAILGEGVQVQVRIEDQGQSPAGTSADLVLSIDGGPDQVFSLPLGQDMSVTLNLPHGGTNVLQLSTPVQGGEVTDRNNGSILRINAVRDRLRVLLVSGEPHAGERTWRNLLKSDSAVDLVHFTILRPPNKFDTAPLNELALIAFPTRELFLEKINDFDLIIFDRYKRLGLLPAQYFENIADYVVNGGAVLVAAGPGYAGSESLAWSPLGEVLPAQPTARVIEQGILPKVSDIGARHPITEGLEDPDNPWGRWMRQIEVEPYLGQTLMTGHNDLPLLMVDRVGAGRVALLASDHAWLWDRGFEGGGPQRELLRRLSHWMMQEPELEEEALWSEENADGLRVIRRTLEEEAPGEGRLTYQTPTGETAELAWTQTAPGRYEAQIPKGDFGLYTITSGDMRVVGAQGPPAPREFANTLPTADLLQPMIDAHQAGVIRVVDGIPRLRDVRLGRPAAGRGWLGLTPRDATDTISQSVQALLPAWAWLLFSAGFLVLAWVREGRD